MEGFHVYACPALHCSGGSEPSRPIFPPKLLSGLQVTASVYRCGYCGNVDLPPEGACSVCGLVDRHTAMLKAGPVSQTADGVLHVQLTLQEPDAQQQKVFDAFYAGKRAQQRQCCVGERHPAPPAQTQSPVAQISALDAAAQESVLSAPTASDAPAEKPVSAAASIPDPPTEKRLGNLILASNAYPEKSFMMAQESSDQKLPSPRIVGSDDSPLFMGNQEREVRQGTLNSCGKRRICKKVSAVIDIFLLVPAVCVLAVVLGWVFMRSVAFLAQFVYDLTQLPILAQFTFSMGLAFILLVGAGLAFCVKRTLCDQWRTLMKEDACS